MKITILTLFPDMFEGPFAHSIVKRAQEKGRIEIELINIRDFGIGKHQIVDDTPYGGGIGMVLKVDVVHKALKFAKEKYLSSRRQEGGEISNQKVILMTASGTPFKQPVAKHYANLDHLIIICGHYEGIDERIMKYVDEEISIGDFVLTGGEIPAMLITDAVTRLIPGVITEGATDNESFSLDGEMLEYPHYTNPQVYDEQEVPEILLSGNHKKIEEWRKAKSQEKTQQVRPDLIKNE